VPDGRYTCGLYEKDLTFSEQKAGCGHHRVIPILLKNWATPVDASDTDNWVRYQMKAGGSEFVNGEPADGFTSQEIYALADKVMLADPQLIELRQQNPGSRVVA
jgi:hypothetical protein